MAWSGWKCALVLVVSVTVSTAPLALATESVRPLANLEPEVIALLERVKQGEPVVQGSGVAAYRRESDIHGDYVLVRENELMFLDASDRSWRLVQTVRVHPNRFEAYSPVTNSAIRFERNERGGTYEAKRRNGSIEQLLVRITKQSHKKQDLFVVEPFAFDNGAPYGTIKLSSKGLKDIDLVEDYQQVSPKLAKEFPTIQHYIHDAIMLSIDAKDFYFLDFHPTITKEIRRAADLFGGTHPAFKAFGEKPVPKTNVVSKWTRSVKRAK